MLQLFSPSSRLKTYWGRICKSLVFNKEMCRRAPFRARCLALRPKPCSGADARPLHLRQFMRKKPGELAKWPQGILEGFQITIFRFNETSHANATGASEHLRADTRGLCLFLTQKPLFCFFVSPDSFVVLR